VAELIKLTQLGKTFGTAKNSTVALQPLDLRIAQGECLAITGASGSGKSTLLSILGLLDSPTSGEYWLKQHAVASLSRSQLSQLRNRHIGWIFQNFNLIGEMTVLENVALPLRFNPEVAPVHYAGLAKTQLDKVGLTDKLHARVSELSGGQQQRVAIARALVNQPGLLLADEPTGNLDSATGHSIMNLLLKLCAEGSTVVIVTHDPAIAAKCSSQIKLSDGALLHD
jgi:putative ABC transport system ATP-binding protein